MFATYYLLWKKFSNFDKITNTTFPEVNFLLRLILQVSYNIPKYPYWSQDVRVKY